MHTVEQTLTFYSTSRLSKADPDLEMQRLKGDNGGAQLLRLFFLRILA